MNFRNIRQIESLTKVFTQCLDTHSYVDFTTSILWWSRICVFYFYKNLSMRC